MKAENLSSSALKRAFRTGVYCTLCTVGLAMTVFIAWSLACIGFAFFKVLLGTA